jgi:hypothetical protein
VADFFKRTTELKQMVGQGKLKGEFAANKIYAVNQHERGWLNHMGRNGPVQIRQQNQGGGKFVEDAWKQMWQDWMEDFADATLKGTLPHAMEGAMKDFDEFLKERAPVDKGNLRNSGTYSVYDQGVVVAHKESGTSYEAT